MKLKVSQPFANIGGTWKGTDLVYATNGFSGVPYAYGKVDRVDPRTCDQLLARQGMRAAVRYWLGMSRAQQEAWNRYAEEVCSKERRRRGLDVCREAARMRLVMGLEPRAEAPLHAPPDGVRTLAVEPAGEPADYCFRVEHAVSGHEGCMLLLRSTPSTAAPSRKPKRNDARCMRGYGPASLVPLPPTGGMVTITGARYAVEPGERFGVAAAIVRIEDGMASPACFFDLDRL